MSFVSKSYRAMENDLWKNFDELSKNVDQELIEHIIAGRQSWQFVRYDREKKKWITRPIFYVKYKWSKRYERLTIKDALPLIGSYFPITDDLKEWIQSSTYQAWKITDLERISSYTDSLSIEEKIIRIAKDKTATPF